MKNREDPDAPQSNLVHTIQGLVSALDDDPSREGLLQTPERIARFYERWITRGEPNFHITTFEAENLDEMVIVKDIPFYSLCEHHMLPFFGAVALAYIPSERIVGLSKIPRIVLHYAQRLQNQERMTQQIADFFVSILGPRGVAVTVRARHLCMEMRGVRSVGNETITSALRGVMKTNSATRAEYYQLMGR